MQGNIEKTELSKPEPSKSEIAAKLFDKQLSVVLETLSDSDRKALVDRSDSFFSIALDQVAKDVMLACVFPVDPARLRQTVDEFKLFRACHGVLKAKRK